MNMPHAMTPLDYIMLVYFLTVVVLINWKGESFIEWRSVHRTAGLLTVLGLFVPWVLYILSAHL